MSDKNGLNLREIVGHLMPWLWAEGVVHNDIDDPAVRTAVRDCLVAELGEEGLPAAYRAINRLIEIGNKTGRFEFRLFPEPQYYGENRWFECSPYIDAVAQRLSDQRERILRHLMVSQREAGSDLVSSRAMLLIALTLDDGWSGSGAINRLVNQGEPVLIGGRPFLQCEANVSTRDESFPIGVIAGIVASNLLYMREGDGARAEITPGRLYRIARMRMRRVGLDLPGRYRDYLAAIRFLGVTEGIPAIAYDRDRTDVGVPVSAQLAARLISGNRAKGNILRENEKSDSDGPTGGQRELFGKPDFGPRVLDQSVRSALHRYRRLRAQSDRRVLAAEIRETIRKLGKPESLEWYLAEWAVWGVGDGESRARQRRISTIYQDYATASRLVLHIDHPFDFDLSSSTAWWSFYDDVINAQKEGVVSSRSWSSVKSFHNYLVRQHGVVSIDLGSLSVEGVQSRVDVNLVTPDEFDTALSLVEGAEGGGHSRTTHLVRLILIMGFRLGLRFEEALGLEIADVEDAADPWICLDLNRWRGVKTDAAKRRLPLNPLLTPDERKELLGWRRRRLEEANGDESAAMFSLGSTIYPPSPGRIRPMIQAVLAQATGDSSIRYHHLRHAFATWAVVRLLRPLIDDRAIAGVSAFSSVDLSLPKCQEWRDQLLMQSPGQEVIWLVSQMMGHVSPAVTRRSYIRLMDWLGLCASWSNSGMSARDGEMLFGLRQSSAYELHAKWATRWWRRVRRGWPGDDACRVLTTTSGPRPISVPKYAGVGVYGDLERLCGAARAVRESTFEGDEALRQMASHYQVEEGNLRVFVQAENAVENRWTTRRRVPRFPASVEIPSQRAERSELAKWVRVLSETVGNRGRWALKDFIRLLRQAGESLSRERSSVRVRSPQAGRVFVADLNRILALPASRILVSIANVQGESAKEFARRRRRVARDIGLPTKQVIVRPGQKPVHRARESVEVSVQAVRTPNRTRRGSEAFRALVHLALVWREMRRLENQDRIGQLVNSPDESLAHLG